MDHLYISSGSLDSAALFVRGGNEAGRGVGNLPEYFFVKQQYLRCGKEVSFRHTACTNKNHQTGEFPDALWQVIVENGLRKSNA
jgi:hypothetical protein